MLEIAGGIIIAVVVLVVGLAFLALLAQWHDDDPKGCGGCLVMAIVWFLGLAVWLYQQAHK